MNQKQKVMVVDRDLKSSLKLARVLEDNGFVVQQADSFIEVAYEALSAPIGEPDLRLIPKLFRVRQDIESEVDTIRYYTHVKVSLEESFGKLLNLIDACGDRIAEKPQPRSAKENFVSDLSRFRDETELLDVLGFKYRLDELTGKLRELCEEMDQKKRDDENNRQPFLTRLFRACL